MLPLVALLLPVLIVLLGFSVDLAYMQLTRAEMRAVADAAARAGAYELSKTDSIEQGLAKARAVAAANRIGTTSPELPLANIEVGRSTPNSQGKWAFAPNQTPQNAFRVRIARSESANGKLPLFFGSLVGVPSISMEEQATASFVNVDVCLVLDRSTSMKLDANGSPGGMFTNDPRFCAPATPVSRWAELDSAVRIFIEELSDNLAEEQVGLVTYSSGETGFWAGFCGMSPQASRIDRELDENLGLVLSAMDDLKATVWNGNTHISAGIEDGRRVLTRPGRARQHAERVMIVMTDGYQNVGNAVAAAAQCPADRIRVNAITFGAGADEATMRNVAAAGNGRHYHAANGNQLRHVFRELAATLARLTD
jgi:Flp pilus assembly protein TadG